MNLRKKERQNWAERLKQRKSNSKKNPTLKNRPGSKTKVQDRAPTQPEQNPQAPTTLRVPQATPIQVDPTTTKPKPDQDFRDKLNDLFTNPKFPTSYSRYLRRYFRDNPTLSRHAPVRKKFLRRKMIVNGHTNGWCLLDYLLYFSFGVS